MPLFDAKFGQVCLKPTVKEWVFPSSAFLSCDTNPQPMQHPPGLLCVASVGLGEQGEPCDDEAHVVCCVVREFFFSDPGVSCLLPENKKLWQPILFASKFDKMSDLSWLLMVMIACEPFHLF